MKKRILILAGGFSKEREISLKTAKGVFNQIKKKYNVKICEPNGDLIKNQLSASFGRGEDDKAEDFKHKVSELGLPVQQKVWVEPMTLKAFARERIANGDELPMDKFGVFVGSKTKLTKK